MVSTGSTSTDTGAGEKTAGAATDVGDHTHSQREGLQVGDSVIARWLTDRRWYAASIRSVSKAGRCTTEVAGNVYMGVN